MTGLLEHPARKLPRCCRSSQASSFLAKPSKSQRGQTHCLICSAVNGQLGLWPFFNSHGGAVSQGLLGVGQAPAFSPLVCRLTMDL